MMVGKDDVMKTAMENLQFSADLNLTMDQVATIVAGYITQLIQHRGKNVLPSDVTFNIKGPTMGEMYEPSTPGSFTAKVKVKL